MARERVVLLSWCAFLMLLIGFGAAWMSQYHSVWSPDSGALYVLAKSWATSGSPAYPAYDLQEFDPKWMIHPLMGPGYVAQTSHGHTLVYGPGLAVLAGTAYRILGFSGLALPSVIGAVLAGLATLLAAREMRLKLWWLAGSIGIATPLVVYGVVFWHHALTICAAAWAFLFLTRALVRNQPKTAIYGGLCLGFGLFFHELSLALMLAATLALAPRWQVIGRFIAGFAVGFVFWAGMNFLLYGTPAGPHVSGANDVLDSHVYRPGLFDIGAMAERGSVQLFGFSIGDYAVVLMLGCLALAWGVRFAIERRGSGSATSEVPPAEIDLIPQKQISEKPSFVEWIPSALVGLLAMFAVTTWPRDTFNNGLFQTTPLFAMAILAPTFRRPECAFAIRMCTIFIVMVVMNPIPPLMGWGSRFLVTVSAPLLCLTLAAAEQRTNRWLLVPLLFLSIVSQGRGLHTVNNDLVYSQDVGAAARSFNAPLIIQVAWIGPELMAADLKYPLMVVGDTLYTPMDRAAARAKADQYLREFQPPTVVFFGQSDPTAPMDREIRAQGYVELEHGIAGGLPYIRYGLDHRITR